MAMTRAKDFWYVLWPLRYFTKPLGVSDNHNYAQCCRFFTKEVLQSMDIDQIKENDLPDPGVTHANMVSRINGIWE